MAGRIMALGPAHLAKVARKVDRVAYRSPFTKLTRADREAVADRLVADLAGGPFWVFAYGSLIWKPEFEHVEERRGRVHGWRRSFCLCIEDWRATPDQPGLMLAL
ncbi:MAG: gamma-glutamylcyclotransferase, partial [Tabrizicola sp.]